jgi:hypothetical protein
VGGERVAATFWRNVVLVPPLPSSSDRVDGLGDFDLRYALMIDERE